MNILQDDSCLVNGQNKDVLFLDHNFTFVGFLNRFAAAENYQKEQKHLITCNF